MIPEQTAQFRDKGYLLLPRAVKEQVVQPVRAHVLGELKKQRIWSSGRTLSARLKGVPPFKQVTMLGQALKYPALSTKLLSQFLVSTIQELAGAHVVPEQDAQLLVSLPNQGEWTLEGLNWHRDISPSKPGVSPGIQAFFLIDDVLPNGGATLALPGSHRLIGYRSVNPGAGRNMKVDRANLSILEMSGRAGDVYLMDMRLVHAPSINATKNVRMMATIRYFVV